MPVLDDVHGLGDSAHVAIRRPSSAGHEADSLGPSGNGSVSRIGGLDRIDPVVLEHVGIRASPLRTVGTVLGTQATLHVDDEIQLHPVAEEVPPYSPTGRDDIQQVIVRAGKDSQGLMPLWDPPAQRPEHQIVERRFEFDSHERNRGIPGSRIHRLA